MVNQSYDKKRAVVFLPAAGGGRIGDARLRRWLARSDIRSIELTTQILERILDELAVAMPGSGLAALRMWGQTGERPNTWVAAADPIYLEPQLDRLRLHALQARDLPTSELRRLVDHLQQRLGDEYGFELRGNYCYLVSDTPLATAALPPACLDQCVPTEFLPGGDERASHRRLLSEIEMALHDHEVNVQRQASGRPVINSLWIWGGGLAPQKDTHALPLLFADDPLLRGFWHSQSSQSEPWPGDVASCIEISDGPFVAMPPDPDCEGSGLEDSLEEMYSAVQSNHLTELVLLFDDGLRAEVRKSQRFRFWRRDHGLLDAGRLQ